jgi:GTPase SAR1 family protein
MALPLDKEALNQLKGDQSRLLDKVDELRTLGVGELVELPQIVVCGNQSSGKSSVLEAISRVRFPRKAGLCTRFATEFVLRRSPVNEFKISIEPGKSRTDAKQLEKLRKFASKSLSTFSDLSVLIESAKECMGISDADGSSSIAGFSDDVLKVEISGPDRPELTLVDLPGLYQATSPDQDKEGMRIVRSLTERYIKSSRTIILAVISAQNDFHLQGVLDIARQFDPEYERVLGIVTRPDSLQPGSEEEDYYLQLIKNEKVKLQLGWHVLRNRDFLTMDVSDDSRDTQEKEFFKKGKWASLPRGQVAIESLRHRLSNILLRHICRNLPGLVADIQTKILHHEQALARIGKPRETLEEQRRFLFDISTKFSRIMNQALSGVYADPFFAGYRRRKGGKGPCSCRLRGNVRMLNECFAEAMSLRGSRRFVHLASEPPKDLRKEATVLYLEGWTPDYISRHKLEEEVREKARECQGIELPGNVNQLLIGELFRDQCQPWKGIAEAHVLNVWNAAVHLVQQLMIQLVDTHTYDLIMGHLMSPELVRLKRNLFLKLDELVSYYHHGNPLLVGDTFLAKLKEIRRKDQLDALKETFGLPGLFSSSQKTIERADLERAADRLQSSNDRFGAKEIIDQMQAYYDVSNDRISETRLGGY